VVLRVDLWNAVVEKAEASGVPASRLVEQVLMGGIGLAPVRIPTERAELSGKSDVRRSRRSLLIDGAVWGQLQIEGRRRGVSVATVVRELLRDAMSSLTSGRVITKQTEVHPLQKISSAKDDPAPVIRPITFFDLK
jgi:hypothetical protein